MEAENWDEFVAFHAPELAKDEVKHGVLLDILLSDEHDRRQIRCWSLGDRPGGCAVMISGSRVYRHDLEEVHWDIVLGDPNPSECRYLAEMTLKLPYPGVIGPDLTAQWFAAHAAEHGIAFPDVEPQQIYRIDNPPVHPTVPGYIEMVTPDSITFTDWLPMFAMESSPHAPRVSYAESVRIASEGRYFFWMVDGEPMSMAGIVRRLNHTAAITGVYTPVEHRGKGYAGAVTAAVVERIHKEGRTATLYTDIRSPAPNRCYKRIGFEGVYTSLHFHR